MTQEEKAKAYDNVREKIAIRFGSNVAKEIFSEYEESEDEKIRKELLEHCKRQAVMYNTLQTAKEYRKVQSWIAWLEKQGEKAKYHDICDKCVRQPTCQSDCFLQQDEQKNDWSEEDEMMLECTLDKIGDLGTGEMCKDWLKSIKDRVQPKQEWSKEDRRHIEELILNVNAKEFPDEVDWLISLHEKIAPPYWDKEDEEMLNQAIQEVEYALNDKNIAFSGREPVLL